jgi:catechol 2,3-dioxygenase-like lactoylglutathione lyase family enzyme
MHVASFPMIAIMLTPFVLWGLLFILSEYGNVSMKPLIPWLVVLCWVLYGTAVVGVIANRHWRFAVFSVYGGTGLVYSWVKRRYLFDSNVKPSRSLASVLVVPEPMYVAVRDVATTSRWYAEKFGLRKLSPTDEIGPDAVALQFEPGKYPVILVPPDPTTSRPVPVFFARNILKARRRPIADGVNAGPLQEDRQGTKFFELLDGEGNTVEVCERT